jgi:hypothetical protein
MMTIKALAESCFVLPLIFILLSYAEHGAGTISRSQICATIKKAIDWLMLDKFLSFKYQNPALME